jgi:hypothetical protein
MKSPIFWDMALYGPSKMNRRFKGRSRLSLQDLVFLLGLFFDPEEAIFSSEISVDFQRTTRRCILENRTVHNHRRDKLKQYKIFV